MTRATININIEFTGEMEDDDLIQAILAPVIGKPIHRFSVDFTPIPQTPAELLHGMDDGERVEIPGRYDTNAPTGYMK